MTEADSHAASPGAVARIMQELAQELKMLVRTTFARTWTRLFGNEQAKRRGDPVAQKKKN
jgi:hypothetical protein